MLNQMFHRPDDLSIIQPTVSNLAGWLMSNGTFSTNDLYHAMDVSNTTFGAGSNT